MFLRNSVATFKVFVALNAVGKKSLGLWTLKVLSAYGMLMRIRDVFSDVNLETFNMFVNSIVETQSKD